MTEIYAYWARRTIKMANEEAARLNHQYIGTEHVHLALLKQHGGMAVRVLNELQIDPRKINAEVEQAIHAGQRSLAKNVTEYALAESQNLQSKQVDTEHILIALLRDHGTVAAQVLGNNGLTFEQVREAMERINTRKSQD